MTSRNQSCARSLAAAACGSAVIALSPLAARADARNDLALSFGSPNAPAVAFSTLVHGSSEREEMVLTSPISIHLVALEQCDKDRYIVMDSVRKIYTSEPLTEAPQDLMGIPNFDRLLNPNRGNVAGATTGAFTTRVTVKDLGTGTAPDVGVTAHHYSVDSHRVSSGAAGTGDTTSHADIWIDPAMMRPNCPARERTTRMVRTATGASISYTLTGDIDLYNQMSRYLPVQMAVTGPGGGVLTFKRTNGSLAAQDPSLFTVPSGYKQLSLAAFAQAEQDAAIDAVAGPQPKLPK